jgi:hypothetical protein|tara:strand:- start:492 stop:626 length:135 start_codon:yes stop_codon:yes gene_type:complete
MIKKIILTFVLCYLLISCGKKGDPVYKKTEKETKIQNIHLNKVS